MKYRFLPYARRAAGASIVNGQTDTLGRPQAEITLRAESQERDGALRTADHTQSYRLFGPGDVTGIDPSQVILTSPRADTHNMEPNYLAHIEFAHPDLPWLFTPEGPDGDRLRPWIALVVVEEPPTERRVTTRPGCRNPVLVANEAELPDLNEAWAWAHVQTMEAGEAAADLLGEWEAHRGLVLSRLLAPRRLQANRHYVACVVPTFAAGVQAGLGELPTKGGELAWTADAGSVTRLPVYYHWRFATGPAGDFESLAQKLNGVAADKIQGVGLRMVHLDASLSRLEQPSPTPAFPAQIVPVRTAIAPHAEPGPLSPRAANPTEPDRTAISTRLKSLIDCQERTRRNGSDDLIVGPPIYGQWHAERRSLDDQIETAEVVMPDATAWVAELNADVEMRTVTAVGTRVVQSDQEDLMARAWEQLQAVAEANRRARWGQLYQASTRLLYDRRISPRPVGSLLRLAAPVLGRLPGSDVTTSIAAELQTTALPRALIGATFSRATRFATRTVAAASSVTQILDATVAPMLNNDFYTASRARLKGVAARLSPTAMGSLLKQAGISDQISASTGLTIDDHVDRLNNLPNLIRDTGGKITMPAQLEQQPALEPGVQERFTPAVLIEAVINRQQRAAVMDVARELLADQPDSAILANRTLPSFNRDLTVLAEEPALPQALHLSPDALALLNARQLARVAAQPVAVQPVENQDTAIFAGAVATHFAISGRQLGELRTIATNWQLDAARETNLLHYTSIRSATMAQFHVDEPLAAWATMGQDRATITEYGNAIGGIAAELATAQPIALPKLTTFDAADLQQRVVARLDPVIQYDKMLKWFLPIDMVGPRRPRRRTPSHAIMAAPRFVDPVVERLKRIDQQWVLGHAEKLPLNSISVLAANARFVEALLVGANYEMARELQWRRYPTDLMGTCFARFWPLPPNDPDDIEPIAFWNRKLGEHTLDSDRNPGEDAVIVVRGDLLRRYPNTIISAVRGKVEQSPDGAHFVPEPGVEPARELFRGILAPDITYAGLAVSLKELKDISAAPNFWFIALTQPADAPRFGLDDDPAVAPNTAVATLNKLSWQSLPVAAVAGEHLRAGVVIPAQGGGWAVDDGETPVVWGPSSDGGQVAAILLQLPFQLLLKASDYL